MLLGLLLTLNIMVCLALIAVVLLQRSEGGALGSGSPTGLITTRGAGDLLTRTTWILFSMFLAISLALTLLGGHERSSQSILNRLRLQSVNPDALKPQAPAPTETPAAGGAAPTSAPLAGAGLPPASGLPASAAASPPPVLAAPKPRIRVSPAPGETPTPTAPTATINSAPAVSKPVTAPAATSTAPAPTVPKLLSPSAPPPAAPTAPPPATTSSSAPQ